MNVDVILEKAKALVEADFKANGDYVNQPYTIILNLENYKARIRYIAGSEDVRLEIERPVRIFGSIDLPPRKDLSKK